MPEPSPLTASVTQAVRKMLEGEPSAERLAAALRYLAKWRASVVGSSLAARLGPVIGHGPFRGMNYGVAASEGSFPARLLGCYEASLAPVIEEIVGRAYPLVIDIGSAEGYYAVGLARRMPATRVWARDASDKAQALCSRLAELNGVAAQVEVGGIITHADLAVCAAQPTALIVDIEGAEGELLDPAAAPALRQADILVEVHEGMRPGLMAALKARFAASHEITDIGRRLDDAALPGFAEDWSDLDRLIALWEWRASPTPWLWMQARR